MATPEQQRRTAEITRILAANGWGVTAIGEDGAATTVTIQKPSAATRAGSITEKVTALNFLVGQFRWEVTQYTPTPDHHTAVIKST